MPVVVLLVITVPSGSMTAINSSIVKVLEHHETRKPRGEYQIYTAKERVGIGKRVAIYGINSMIRYYKINPERPLPLSSVFDFKLKYQEELSKTLPRKECRSY